MSMIPWNAASTASSPCRLSTTPPTSVLCAMSGEAILRTIKPFMSRAAATACFCVGGEHLGTTGRRSA